jgi:hypothetical protein
LNNVHEDAPEVFQTRWTLSYLRGPLTRTQIKALMEPMKLSGYRGKGIEGYQQPEGAHSRYPATPLSLNQRPMLPPDVPQHFIPLRGKQPSGSALVYQPMLLGASQVRVSDSKVGVDVTQDVTVLAPISDGAVAVDWDRAVAAGLAVDDLESAPSDGAQFAAVPSAASKAKNYEAWNRDFAGWLFRTQKVDLSKSPSAKEHSMPGESERDFRVRLQQSGREARDKQSDSLRQKYAPKIAALQARIRRAGQMVERQQAESRSSQMQAAISVGASILGAFLGRKTISATNIGRATTAIRGAGRAIKESKDVGQAEENVSALRQQLADLETQFKTESELLAAATDPLTEKLETLSLKPAKSNISIRLVALAWTPYWRDPRGAAIPAWA